MFLFCLFFYLHVLLDYSGKNLMLCLLGPFPWLRVVIRCWLRLIILLPSIASSFSRCSCIYWRDWPISVFYLFIYFLNVINCQLPFQCPKALNTSTHFFTFHLVMNDDDILLDLLPFEETIPFLKFIYKSALAILLCLQVFVSFPLQCSVLFAFTFFHPCIISNILRFIIAFS